MSPLEKLHFGKKSLGLWLHLTKEHGSLIKAFNPTEIHSAFEHYPSEDILSNSGSIQYFYHSHRDSGEHGHIHIFNRAHKTTQTNHLLAIGLTEKGLPISLFTVKDDSVNEKSPGKRVLKQLLIKSLSKNSREAQLTDWIIAFCTFYKEAILNLFMQESAAQDNKTMNNDILAFTAIDWEEDLELCEQNAHISDYS